MPGSDIVVGIGPGWHYKKVHSLGIVHQALLIGVSIQAGTTRRFEESLCGVPGSDKVAGTVQAGTTKGFIVSG